MWFADLFLSLTFVLFKELLCFVPQFVTVIHTKRSSS